jgi:hypothetical protein
LPDIETHLAFDSSTNHSPRHAPDYNIAAKSAREALSGASIFPRHPVEVPKHYRLRPRAEFSYTSNPMSTSFGSVHPFFSMFFIKIMQFFSAH